MRLGGRGGSLLPVRVSRAVREVSARAGATAARRSGLCLVAGLLVWAAAGWVAAGARAGDAAAPPVGGAAAVSPPAAGQGPDLGGLAILYPEDGTLFPPEIAPPTFRWKDEGSGADAWRVTLEFPDGAGPLEFLCDAAQWKPEPAQWAAIKTRSTDGPAEVTVTGMKRAAPGPGVSRGRISIRTSRDEVGAPIFYREVNLPFKDAVVDPSHIRWRFGAVSSAEPPPVVLENLPLCGNCHSFSADGRALAMDIDYANSKGSYIITPVAAEMALRADDVITWNDYRKEDREQTFGLLSQISPDGRAVISTVKDKSVFVPMPDLAFSQLFFPLKGILVVYDRQAKTFEALPGAADPRYVQSNPTWSPDGKTIVFARAPAYDLKHTQGMGKLLLTRDECKEFVEDGEPFRFDLYRVPYNEGRGGTPEPIAGASGNGLSNYFARYSPDGRWIVFCRARSYMLLQSDSELYILPAEGGEARRLRANTPRMNSWHSWSPNGRWLVFASKAYSPYTHLCLTHIDAQGESTPPVLLEAFITPDRAANIPEFVNATAGAIRRIEEKFIDDRYRIRVGDQFLREGGEIDLAIVEYRKALDLNPTSAEAHQKLGLLLYNAKHQHEEGMEHYRRALELDPNYAPTYHDLGMAMLHQGRLDEGIRYLSEAVRRMPEGGGWMYDAALIRYHLANALLTKGEAPGEAAALLSDAARRAPDNARIQYALAAALVAQGKIEDVQAHYARAVALDPTVDTSSALHERLAVNLAGAGRFREAVAAAEKALAVARATGRDDRTGRIETLLRLLREKAAAPAVPAP